MRSPPAPMTAARAARAPRPTGTAGMIGADRRTRGELPMTQARMAQRGPYPVDVEAGKTCHWCRCDRNAKQPFCDGSHEGTGFSPTEYHASRSETVYFCGGKSSGKGSLCDGTHNKL
jgi:CDGSH-type Zn-finger protein